MISDQVQQAVVKIREHALAAFEEADALAVDIMAGKILAADIKQREGEILGNLFHKISQEVMSSLVAEAVRPELERLLEDKLEQLATSKREVLYPRPDGVAWCYHCARNTRTSSDVCVECGQARGSSPFKRTN